MIGSYQSTVIHRYWCNSRIIGAPWPCNWNNYKWWILW